MKSDSVTRVLQLMDSCEDGQERYVEFMAQVASEDNVSVEQLETELNQYI